MSPFIYQLIIMPTCRVCLNKSDSIPVGGVCSTCVVPENWKFNYNSTPYIKKDERVMCVTCHKPSGFTKTTVVNACWGKTNMGQNCWKCHSTQQGYRSGVSSFNMCCGLRD